MFSQNLEELIYLAAETFINNQNEATFQLLHSQETTFKKQVKSKDEQLALVFLQSHKGYYLDKNSKLKDAVDTYEDLLKRYHQNDLSKLSDFDIIENCLIPLGNLYTKTGDFTNAESSIKQYIFLAEKSKKKSHQISGAINLAKLYQTINKHETVLNIVNAALKNETISKAQKELLQNIKTSSLLALNKYDEATLLNQTASASAFDKHKNDALMAFKNNDFEKALASFQKAKTFLNEAELPMRYLAKFYFNEAELLYKLNKTEAVLKSLKQAIKVLLPNYNSDALPNKTDLYAENTFIDIFDLYAEMETNPKTILKSFDLSFYVSDLLYDSWTSQESKILNERNNRIRSEKCIHLLYETFKITKNKSLLFEAFKYAENNKVSTLKDMIQKKIRLQQFPNDSLLTKEFELLKAQELITGQLKNEQLNSNRASKINLLSKKLSEISLQLKSLKQTIYKKYPEEDTFFSLELLQNMLLKDEAVLVEYFYGENNIYQFIVSNKNIQLYEIILNDTKKKQNIDFIHLFDNATVINNNIPNFTKKAFELFNLLKFNIIPKDKHVIIIPDGLLNFVPFETLLNEKTDATSYSKMPFLVKAQNIVYNSSVFFYLTKSKSIKNNKLLGFFPVFNNSEKKLTYSINEADAIENEMNATLYRNNKASKTNFIKNASNYHILHLSTHASSGNYVTPANIDFYNETLYLNELYSLNINANLVVLSACETGIGTLQKGEGAMSIARGFQYAGAQNLMFSLWQINDLSTSQIMQSFYENYNNTQSAYVSNRQSKLDYLQNEDISNIKKSPYYWGAFVYYGELAKPNESHQLLYIIIGIIVLLLFIIRKIVTQKIRKNEKVQK